MQLLHAVLPASAVNVPAAHKSHVARPASAPNEPGKHACCSAEPTEHAWPASHVMHCSTLLITSSDVFLRVPPGHGSGAADCQAGCGRVMSVMEPSKRASAFRWCAHPFAAVVARRAADARRVARLVLEGTLRAVEAGRLLGERIVRTRCTWRRLGRADAAKGALRTRDAMLARAEEAADVEHRLIGVRAARARGANALATRLAARAVLARVAYRQLGARTCRAAVREIAVLA